MLTTKTNASQLVNFARKSREKTKQKSKKQKQKLAPKTKIIHI